MVFMYERVSHCNSLNLVRNGKVFMLSRKMNSVSKIDAFHHEKVCMYLQIVLISKDNAWPLFGLFYNYCIYVHVQYYQTFYKFCLNSRLVFTLLYIFFSGIQFVELAFTDMGKLVETTIIAWFKCHFIGKGMCIHASICKQAEY